MLGTDDKVRSEMSNTPVNMTSSLPLEHIESFRHPVATRGRPGLSEKTEINNNHPDVAPTKDFHHTGYYTHGMLGNESFVYSAHQPYKCPVLNNNVYVSNNVQKTHPSHTLTSNTPRDSIEHVPNAPSHSLSSCSESIVPFFYRESSYLHGRIKAENETSDIPGGEESTVMEQPCKRRRLSDPRENTETAQSEVPQPQTSTQPQLEHRDRIKPEVVLNTSTVPGSDQVSNIQKTPDPKPFYYHGSPYYLPFYPPVPVYGGSTTDTQQVPQVPGSTYLTPSRQSPIMSTYQTPKGRAKQACQRRLTSPADSDNSCDKSYDEDSEIDVINDVRDSSVSVENKDSDVSMTSLKSSKSTSPSGSSSTGSPSTVSPDDGCRKKTRTNYTPVQVQALEKVFHENPYPDAEKMEQMSKELEIPENKLKVWFQNKRARWRRRMSDSAHQVPRGYMGLSPVISPISSFGFMGHMMPPPMSPAQVVPGHFARSTSQTSPTTSQGQKMTSQVTPPHQSRGHFPQYMPVYPYGMFSPYYYS